MSNNKKRFRNIKKIEQENWRRVASSNRGNLYKKRFIFMMRLEGATWSLRILLSDEI